MTRTVLAGALAGVLAVGCASVPEPAGPDIAGIYSFTTTVQGMGVSGQMRITGEPGAYEGSMYSDMTGEIPFSYIEAEGNTAVLVAETPDGPVEIRLTFDGDAISGSWALGPEGGAIRGRRVER